MVVSELVRGRHLSRGAEPGASPIQLPRSGLRLQAGSLQRSDFLPRHQGALWSGVAPENPALLKWGEWAGRGSPLYSRQGAHSHRPSSLSPKPRLTAVATSQVPLLRSGVRLEGKKRVGLLSISFLGWA